MLRNSGQLSDLIDNMRTQWNKADMKRRRQTKMRKCRSRAPIHLAKLFYCCLPGSRFGHGPRIVPRDQKVARVYNNLGKGFVLQTFTAREDRRSRVPARTNHLQQPKNTESGAEVRRGGRRRLCQDEKAEQSQVAGAGRARACGDAVPSLLVSIPTAHRVHSQQDGTNTSRCNHSTSSNTSRCRSALMPSWASGHTSAAGCAQ